MTMRTTAGLRSATLAAAVALLVAGCIASESGERTAGGASPTAAVPDSESIEPSAASAAAIDPADPPAPIASATIPATAPERSDPDASMRVDLVSLKRQDALVVATFAFTPDSTETEPQTLYSWLGASSFDPFALDPENLRRHDAVSKTESVSTSFTAGQTFYAVAAFASPPEDVTSMVVTAVSGAPAFENVQIQ